MWVFDIRWFGRTSRNRYTRGFGGKICTYIDDSGFLMDIFYRTKAWAQQRYRYSLLNLLSIHWMESFEIQPNDLGHPVSEDVNGVKISGF